MFFIIQGLKFTKRITFKVVRFCVYSNFPLFLQKKSKMNRTIITVVGKDTIGIIAKVCTYLAEKHVNILDISQTIVQGFFNMMMIVDTSAMTVDFNTFSKEIDALGENTGVQIKCQKEDIFDKMHRI